MGEGCPNLLDFVGNNNRGDEDEDKDENRHGRAESSNLELRLGLPGDHLLKNNPVRKRCSFPKLGFPSNQWIHHHNCSSTGAIAIGMHNVDLQSSEVKGFSAVNNSSHTRGAHGAVVGWPPVRSFRKNIANRSSSKQVSEPHSSIPSKPLDEKPGGSNSNKGMFVKINMDGVPIGRKVDLNAYDTYQKLSSSVDVLFRGLLAARLINISSTRFRERGERRGAKNNNGVIRRKREYTLVYEGSDGDRMLLGDVPWPMFLSTVKRLRVIKTSDLSTLCRGGSKNEKEAVKTSSK